ncbi:hypothetical protein PUN4_280298 [Paraburkholderia unamae]|nr:hypothetical protein PUN4_280298 [Paraburkholderia unamae]
MIVSVPVEALPRRQPAGPGNDRRIAHCGSVDAALSATPPGRIIARHNSGYPVKESS